MGYAKDTSGRTPNNVYVPHSSLLTFAFVFGKKKTPPDTDKSDMNNSPLTSLILSGEIWRYIRV
jgi:hypothetical protein